MVRLIALSFALFFGGTDTVFAESAPNQSTTEGVDKCIAIKRDSRRLDCYDALFLPAEAKANRLGQEHLDRAVPATDPDAIDSFNAKVVKLTKRSRGELVFELDNDQVWLQTTPRFLSIKEGDSVTVKRSRMGSYALRTDKGAATRVKRIR